MFNYYYASIFLEFPFLGDGGSDKIIDNFFLEIELWTQSPYVFQSPYVLVFCSTRKGNQLNKYIPTETIGAHCTWSIILWRARQPLGPHFATKVGLHLVYHDYVFSSSQALRESVPLMG